MAATALVRLGIRLHPEKSGIICLAPGGQGFFHFLGFYHRKSIMEMEKQVLPQRWPSTRAMRVLRDICVVTAGSKIEQSVSAVVADPKPVLRGWTAYFRNGNSGRKPRAVDGYIDERLTILPAGSDHPLRIIRNGDCKAVSAPRP
ncbi:group II intron maturase-specific domain-containing protein [Streptomyces smyrnaeus]|uniref:group II intron maturase-specific domain-containing protein n=1 Tax=Streptomyces smyrnaeus TaxID=1387713 RepID=UPI003698D70C